MAAERRFRSEGGPVPRSRARHRPCGAPPRSASRGGLGRSHGAPGGGCRPAGDALRRRSLLGAMERRLPRAREERVIPVTGAAEPPTFDAVVRQPGLSAIAELVGESPLLKRRGPRRKPVAT